MDRKEESPAVLELVDESEGIKFDWPEGPHPMPLQVLSMWHHPKRAR